MSRVNVTSTGQGWWRGTWGSQKRQRERWTEQLKLLSAFQTTRVWADSVNSYNLKKDNSKEKEMVFEELRWPVSYFYTLSWSCNFLIIRAKSELWCFLGNGWYSWRNWTYVTNVQWSAGFYFHALIGGRVSPSLKSGAKPGGSTPRGHTQRGRCPRSQSWGREQVREGKGHFSSAHVNTRTSHNP